MRRGALCQKWDKHKIARFISDWTDGLDAPALRERYNLNYSPSVLAGRLRQRGYSVPYRQHAKQA